MNFLLLTIQSIVCVACVIAVKQVGLISFRDFNVADAKRWYPISLLLVSVIYTGSKSIVSILVGEVNLSADSRTAIPEHSRIYNLQKLDHHSDCTSHTCLWLAHWRTE